MGKLKLQMHITLDGFSGKDNGDMDWMSVDWSKQLHEFTINNLNDVDYIVIPFGKKQDDSFLTYWATTADKPADPFFEVAKKIMATPKLVVSKYKVNASFPGTQVVQGDVIDEVTKLKREAGKSIMVYGGITFSASVIAHDLVDEFYFLLNPVAIGNGLSVFKDVDETLTLVHVSSTADACGIVVNKYVKKK
jgi:dihydrofolate reductase